MPICPKYQKHFIDMLKSSANNSHKDSQNTWSRIMQLNFYQGHQCHYLGGSYTFHKTKSRKYQRLLKSIYPEEPYAQIGPYATNVFFIKKKDGKLHPVQDYHPLNKWTKKNQNVSPLIPQVVD